MGGGNGTTAMSDIGTRVGSGTEIRSIVVVYLHGVLVVLQWHLTKTVLPYNLLVAIVNKHHLDKDMMQQLMWSHVVVGIK